jgi:hypothetical protein
VTYHLSVLVAYGFSRVPARLSGGLR